MLRAAAALALLFAVLFGEPDEPEAPEPLAACGVERWDIKTCADPAAAAIPSNAVQTTIANMRLWPRPTSLGESRVAPYETTVWEVEGAATLYKREDDSDIHLVLADAFGNTIITEIPDPACYVGGTFAAEVAATKAAFESRFVATSSFKTANVPVRLRGVGFFDYLHGQTGLAPNGIELHPVLSIEFLDTPGPPPVPGAIVISQIYGGGGNTGATLRNDFVELFNRGSTDVNITGWTIQHAGPTGTTWDRTTLSGTIRPGGYYLVQEAQGAGGSASLPAPDAVGGMMLSATSAKIALVSSSTLLVGGCPANVVDFVGYGSSANCAEGTRTADLSNFTAAFRRNGGCQDTGSNANDFTVAAPSPRNSSTAVHLCQAPTPTVTATAAPPSPTATATPLPTETPTVTRRLAPSGPLGPVTIQRTPAPEVP